MYVIKQEAFGEHRPPPRQTIPPFYNAAKFSQ